MTNKINCTPLRNDLIAYVNMLDSDTSFTKQDLINFMQLILTENKFMQNCPVKPKIRYEQIYCDDSADGHYINQTITINKNFYSLKFYNKFYVEDFASLLITLGHELRHFMQIHLPDFKYDKNIKIYNLIDLPTFAYLNSVLKHNKIINENNQKNIINLVDFDYLKYRAEIDELDAYNFEKKFAKTILKDWINSPDINEKSKTWCESCFNYIEQGFYDEQSDDFNLKSVISDYKSFCKILNKLTVKELKQINDNYFLINKSVRNFLINASITDENYMDEFGKFDMLQISQSAFSFYLSQKTDEEILQILSNLIGKNCDNLAHLFLIILETKIKIYPYKFKPVIEKGLAASSNPIIYKNLLEKFYTKDFNSQTQQTKRDISL